MFSRIARRNRLLREQASQLLFPPIDVEGDVGQHDDHHRRQRAHDVIAVSIEPSVL